MLPVAVRAASLVIGLLIRWAIARAALAALVPMLAVLAFALAATASAAATTATATTIAAISPFAVRACFAGAHLVVARLAVLGRLAEFVDVPLGLCHVVGVVLSAEFAAARLVRVAAMLRRTFLGQIGRAHV